MLAYIFWHWPGSDTGYEAALMAFHGALWTHPPRGFLGSRVMRVGPRPWLVVPSAYEDWYFVEDFAALGTLNEAATSGPRKAPHDAIASLPLGGTGALYALVKGALAGPRFASFRSKSTGVTYASYLAALPVHAETWQRQMVLGSAPEFCLLTDHALSDSMVIDVLYSRRKSP